MGVINRSCVALALIAVSSATVSAQEFDPEKIRTGKTVFVRDAAGAETKGVVQSVEPAKLVVKYRAAGIEEIRTFASADVSRVRLPGPVWDGALGGAVIGLIPGVLVGRACQGCGGAGLGIVGIGAAIGLGIDAAFPPKTVYRRSAPRRTVSIVPTLSRNGGGIAASLRF